MKKWKNFSTSREGTFVWKSSNKFGFSLTYSYLSPLVKVGCISEMKINPNLFCISLDLHYLSPLEKALSFSDLKVDFVELNLQSVALQSEKLK